MGERAGRLAGWLAGSSLLHGGAEAVECGAAGPVRKGHFWITYHSDHLPFMASTHATVAARREVVLSPLRNAACVSSIS